MIWLHERNSPAAHSLRRRDWDAQEAHCGKRFDHDIKAGPLEVWSKPCEDCMKAREARR